MAIQLKPEKNVNHIISIKPVFSIKGHAPNSSEAVSVAGT